MLKDKLGDVLADTATLKDAVAILRSEAGAFFSREFLLPRPILQAILSPQPSVLLIDEIDRADQEFEAFLLEVLSDFQVTIPELGTLHAIHRPLVVLTSNATRRLSEALRRRCLYLYIDLPTFDDELRVLRRKVKGIDDRLSGEIVRFVQRVRKLDLRKTPGISETLDWAMALVVLGADTLSREVVSQSLAALLKDREDVARVLQSSLR
jgi:MoxR-like ATPase